MGVKLMAIVAEGTKGRVYLGPTSDMEALAKTAKPTWSPELKLPDNPRDFKTPNYGMKTYGDLFTSRQLVALTTFSDLVGEARERIRKDAIATGMVNDDVGLEAGGTGAKAYAEAVSVYLAFGVSYAANYWSQIATPAEGFIRGTFSKQALPMTWDFAEAPPFGETSGNWLGGNAWIEKAIQLLPARNASHVAQIDAQQQRFSKLNYVSTDPPYYDNIGYADLSDYFYVWLRRSLRLIAPQLLATISVPKAEELVATPYRHGSKEKAENFFLTGMTHAMQLLATQAHPSAPITIYYAFKQSETEANESATSSTGWETFLDAVIRSGLSLTGTWPVRTERTARSVSIGTNSLASSIVLVCRPRMQNAGTINRKQFVRLLNDTLPVALAAMTRTPEPDEKPDVEANATTPSTPTNGKKKKSAAKVTSGSHVPTSPVSPVDLSQAIIGPGMAIFSKYDVVLEADGKPMTVKTALQLINRFLAGDDFDPDTQFCLLWFEQYHWAEGKFGEADKLARAKGTAVDGVKAAGVLEAGGGNVRLLKWTEYPTDWDAKTDTRLPIWEALHHLIRAYNTEGDSGAGRIMAAISGKAEVARQLAYRLYTLCERANMAEDARAYNELVTGWSGIETAATKVPTIPKSQDLFE